MKYGGGHHTVLTLALSEEQLEQLARLFKVDFINIK